MQDSAKNREAARGIGIALFSALAYGVSIPVAKLFEDAVTPMEASALLYLGAGLCMLCVRAVDATRRNPPDRGRALKRSDIPLLAVMILLNAASAIALLAGIFLTDAASASLLGNFEVAATALFAFLIFKERMGPAMWAAVGLITIASLLLSWDPSAKLSLSPGSLLVILACILWGLENNCTRALSECNVVDVTAIKGFGTAAACAAIGLVTGMMPIGLGLALAIVALGAFSYGLSIMLYISAQRLMGAARTGNYYSAAPFIGVAVSWLLFGFSCSATFLPALLLTLAGVALTTYDVRRSS